MLFFSSIYVILFVNLCVCVCVCVFQNPDGVVVKQVSRIQAFDGVFADTFPLSEIVK